MPRLRPTLALLALLLCPAVGWAAQDAEIIADRGEVKQTPDEKALVLQVYAKGSIIRVSEESKNGWYKVHLPGPDGGSFGWVRIEEIRPSQLAKSLKAAGIQAAISDGSGRTQGWFSLGLYGGLGFLFAPSELQAAAGLDEEGVSPTILGVEAGFRPSSLVSILGSYRTVAYAETLNSGGKVDLTFSRVGLLVDVVYATTRNFKFGLAAGGGLGLTSSVVVATDADSETLTGKGVPYAEARTSIRWYPFTGVALCLQGGYAYFIGDTTFETDAGGDASVSFTSAFGEAGLLIEF